MTRRTAKRLSIGAACLALAAAGGAIPARAQGGGIVRGVVTDAITGSPISGVRISVAGSDLAGTTDGEGAFTIEGVPLGLVKMSAQIVGYVPITTPYYSIRPDSTTTVDFRLAPISVELDPVDVPGQRAIPDWEFGGMVLTPDKLPKRGNIVTALNGIVAGVVATGKHENSRVYARGSFNQMLFVLDGVVVTPPITFYVDASEVDCVEIRRGYQAAAEFRRSLNGETYSGVVLIWTRGSTAPRPKSCYQS